MQEFKNKTNSKAARIYITDYNDYLVYFGWYDADEFRVNHYKGCKNYKTEKTAFKKTTEYLNK